MSLDIGRSQLAPPWAGFQNAPSPTLLPLLSLFETGRGGLGEEKTGYTPVLVPALPPEWPVPVFSVPGRTAVPAGVLAGAPEVHTFKAFKVGPRVQGWRSLSSSFKHPEPQFPEL